MEFKVIHGKNNFIEKSYEELLIDFSISFHNYEEIYKNNNPAIKNSSIYVEKGDLFLIDKWNSTKSVFKKDKTIVTEIDSSGLLYIADESGYVVYDSEKLMILPIEIASKDKQELYFIYIPKVINSEQLKLKLIKQDTEPFDETLPKRITLKEGFLPIQPVNAEFTLLVKPMDRPPILEDGSVDYKSYSKFIEIQKGEKIAIKKTIQEGVPGVDVYGNILEVTKPYDIDIVVGEDVIINDSVYGIEAYIASQTGILQYSKNNISIVTTLKINSDICLATGNINYSRDIEIVGNVKSMFSVNCGGDLHLQGNIENGSHIKCKGSLTVSEGIIGPNTTIEVGNDLYVEYIQDCNIHVGGSIHILNSVYHSYIFAKKYITVEGKKNRSKTHGSVVGGTLNSLLGINIDSVGSLGSGAKLVCGIDLQLKSNFSKLKETILVINSKIIKLQNNLGININNTGNDLGKLSTKERETLKIKLFELKQLIVKKNKMDSIRKKIENNIENKDLESIKIVINKFILDETQISIGKYSLTLKNSEKNVYFSLLKERVIKNPN